MEDTKILRSSFGTLCTASLNKIGIAAATISLAFVSVILEIQLLQATTDNSQISYDDEFEEGVTIAATHPLYLAPVDTSEISPSLFSSAWKMCNAIVLSWLVNAVAPNLISGISYATNAHAVLMDLHERFDKCEFCKLKGHSKENCYKIIGYPSDYKYKKKWGAPTTASNAYNMLSETNNVLKNSTPQMCFLNKASCSSSTANVAGISTAFLATDNVQEWIIDTGATDHMVSDLSMLTSFNIVDPSYSKKVFLPNGDVSYIKHVGTSAISDKSDLFNGRVKAIGREDKCLYILPSWSLFTVNKHTAETSLAATQNEDMFTKRTPTNVDLKLWHKRLGHVSSSVLNKLFSIKQESCISVVKDCSICPCARLTRLPFPSSTNKSAVSFDLLHLDIWGPYNTATINGNRYFLTVVDDYSRMTWIFLLKLKSDVCVVLHDFLMYVKTQFDKQFKCVRTDNGSEFVNSYVFLNISSSVLPHITEQWYAQDASAGSNQNSAAHDSLVLPHAASFSPSNTDSNASSLPTVASAGAEVYPVGSPALRISAKDKHPLLWMKGFVSLLANQRTPYGLTTYMSYDRPSPHYQAFIASSSSEVEPVSYAEVVKDPRWVVAMKSEIAALEDNHTWDVVTIPTGKIPIGCKWVY
ncbi:uncharacterized protein LOC142175761 [Nicotiana tabacum]|uniref:Uncharacterized protein LOC142175761 n=1 Tax=Nicotiana tabacum TaxID=4097 RepID=A0AC58TNQ4_TOBAC